MAARWFARHKEPVKPHTPKARPVKDAGRKKKAKGKKDADSLETRVKKKKAYMLDLDLGEDGALVGDKVVGVSHFQQPLGTALILYSR